MDESRLLGLRCSEDPSSQAQTLQYFEQLKNSQDGWKICGDALLSGIHSDESIKFFCFQVLEHHIKTRHGTSEPETQQALRKLLMGWFHKQCSGERNKNFIRNKAAQVFALAFVTDYPHQWLSFFNDLHQTLGSGPVAVDIYLRILKSIDEVVVDREIARTPQESERNTMIKDVMREQCIQEIVNSWFQILKTYERTDPSLTCLCLEVVGSYVAWIDINLIANDKFIGLLLHFLTVDVLRESVCDCFHEIISKGMDPVAKTDLVESLVRVLENAGVLNPSEDLDNDFLAKLAKLVNCIGTQLVTSYNKLLKPNDAPTAAKTLVAIESKIQLLYRFLGDDDDDISHTVHGFAYSYLSLMKQASTMNSQQKQNVEGILYIVIKKMKYDDSYNFAREDEDEVMFMEFRKEMKVLFDNIAQLDANLVLVVVHNVLNSTLGRLQELDFMDVDIAVRLVFMVGEALPVQQLYTDSTRFGILQQMMTTLVSSRVSYYGHSAVSMMYFESVVRYERFFSSNPEHIPIVLIAFLDERGLRNPNCTVRSRCCYLLSRFIKAHKNHMHNYVDDVLKRLQTLLVTSSDINGYQHLLSADEQLFLYECAGMLIACSGSSPENKLAYMNNLLSPVIAKFNMALSKLVSEVDQPSSVALAQLLYNLVSFASRTSKAFPNQQSLRQSGCAPCFEEALPVFLHALTMPVHRDIIHNGVRQYLHRMVVCLGQDVLQFIPVAVTHLLKDCTARDIQDFIPLINQVIAKFKQQIVPFLCDVFMAIVNTIFTVLSKPVDQADTQATKEKETLRRSYFLFIASIVNNDVAEILTRQEPQNVEQVLLTVIQGAVEYPDPVAQKTCFNVLRKLVELWGGNNGENGFKDFMYDNIVPACFLAPMKSTFDMEDGQTFLAMQEIAQTQKAIFQKQGGEFLNYLQIKYLPSLNLSPSLVQEYTQALQHADMKTFKNYSKAFFTQLQT